MPTRGSTLSDRKAARREQLIEAGIDLLGAAEAPSVSVRAICRHTRLTERYFYESFTDREEFVLAVYEHVGAQAHRALVDAVLRAPAEAEARAEAAVTAFVQLMLDDPRKGRVLLIAPMSDPTLIRRGVELLPSFAALIREQLPGEADRLGRELTSVGLVGALTQLFIGYLNGTLQVSRERLVAHCVHLLANAGTRRP